MWLTRVSINNPYFATVIMLALLLLGIVSYNSISVEEFPNVKFPVVVVTTNYKGASPEVIETDVSRPIEEALNTLNGIKTIRSYSFEGQSVIVAEFNLNVDPEQAINDARDKVSGVSSSFRKEIDKPVVSKVNIRDNPVMSLAFSSNSMSLRDITDWVNRVAKKRIQTIAGVGEVKIIGGVDRQIRINIEPYKLQSLGLSITDINTAIQKANDDFPAGNVKTKNKDISVRLNGKLTTPRQFEDIVVAYRDKVPIKLSAIAIIEDSQDTYNSLTLVNNKRAVGLDIRQAENANLVELSKDVYQKIKDLNKIKPADINISVTFDQSTSIKASLNNVKDTLIEGALLTIFIVFIFLKSWRSTVITGLTLPIALLGTIFAIRSLGFTLNMMSLLALSLSVGLLIDDAIVVRENIVRHLHMGKDHYLASLDGTNEIGLAVLSTTLTIIAVFLPVGLMNGIIGKFFFQFGITVTVAVLISLMVSFSLDPMLSSIWHEPADGGWLKKSLLGKLLDKFEKLFDNLAIYYERLIRLSLEYKKTTMLLTLAVLIGSFMLLPLIGGEFIPKEDKGKFIVNFKTVTGSNVDYTENKILQVDSLMRKNMPEIVSIIGGVNKNFGDGTNNASLTVDIGDKTKRNRSQEELIQYARQLLSHVAGIELQSVMPIGGPGGDQKPINVDIKGDDMMILKSISDELTSKISQIPNTADIENSYQQSNPAVNVKVDREIASDLGINLADVGNTLSTLFAGNKITTWEDPKNGQNYDVVIQVPDQVRSQDVLNLLKIPTNTINNGVPQMVQLSEIATTKAGFAPRELDHIDLQRKITITGNINGNDNQAVFTKIQTLLNNYQLPDGYEIVQSGDSKDMMESLGYAVSALLIGVAFIYMILTAQFRSFILPLVIMVALPLSFIGVFIALLLFHSTLNMFSIIGIIMLMGLATKNGILLVDFIQQELKRGVVLTEALVNAGKIRLRPIMMTSCAMIFGMLPLVFANGIGSEIRKPMAYAIIGGMTTSTILTLVIIPVIFVYISRLSNLFRKN